MERMGDEKTDKEIRPQEIGGKKEVRKTKNGVGGLR